MGRQLQPVLWPGLVAEWELSPTEAAIVDRREGASCLDCGCSMRSQALAIAITHCVDSSRTLAAWTATAPAVRMLEINAAGTLSPWLAGVAGHLRVSYPEIDMHDMPFPDGAWDMVVHSDTVEHVADPVAALIECRRILAPGGALCFTIPVIPGRLTRRRDGLPPSYHGSVSDPTYLVITEYGADFWTQVLDSGFATLTMVSAQWPEAVAYIAQR